MASGEWRVASGRLLRRGRGELVRGTRTKGQKSRFLQSGLYSDLCQTMTSRIPKDS